MKNCRICGKPLLNPIYKSQFPSITSVRTVWNTPITVYMCQNCFHVQKPALQSTLKYYDEDYRISLESDDFDQLYDMIYNKCIYRTDYQAELVLNSIDIPLGSKILDYGAGKATTLMKVSTNRPDIAPHAFDVSDKYKKHWNFFPIEQQAIYTIPESWDKNFFLIMSHFVLEHIEDPKKFLKKISELLVEDGYLFFTVPNVLTNPGDLIAVDHINHFSITSINRLLNESNLSIISIDTNIFRGTITCVAKLCKKYSQDDHSSSSGFSDQIMNIVKFWLEFDAHLDKVTNAEKLAPSAIFGAGVYGSYIASKIEKSVPVKCFLDNSPHLINSNHMGFPVISPSSIPEDIEIIYAGLNPSIARSILEPLKTDKISKIIFFDKEKFNND